MDPLKNLSLLVSVAHSLCCFCSFSKPDMSPGDHLQELSQIGPSALGGAHLVFFGICCHNCVKRVQGSKLQGSIWYRKKALEESCSRIDPVPAGEIHLYLYSNPFRHHLLFLKRGGFIKHRSALSPGASSTVAARPKRSCKSCFCDSCSVLGLEWFIV